MIKKHSSVIVCDGKQPQAVMLTKRTFQRRQLEGPGGSFLDLWEADDFVVGNLGVLVASKFARPLNSSCTADRRC